MIQKKAYLAEVTEEHCNGVEGKAEKEVKEAGW